MSQTNLNRIFKPRQVAVVGASEKAGTIGNALMKNLVNGGFPGTVLPVNPKSKVLNRCTVSCCMRTGTCSRWEKSWGLALKESPIPETMNW